MASAILALAASAALSSNGVRVIVVAEPRKLDIVAAQGISDPITKRPARADDPVRIASISKLAVGLAVLRLVGQGKLDLDRDISDWLGWQVRHPAFPDRLVTLRLLLSHQSGLTDSANYAIPLGETLKERLARPAAWDSAHPPGTWFHYANLNFPVIASVMEAATGTRFDRLMNETLFRPARIDACFNWQGCRPRMIRHAVVLRSGAGEILRDDLKGNPPACPVVPNAIGGCDFAAYRPGDNGALFSPQGGMRISGKGLARLGRLLGNSTALKRLKIDPALLATPQWRFDGRNGDSEEGVYCAYGLAIHFLNQHNRPDCHDDLFGDGRPRMGHSGEAYGLRSGLWVDPATGKSVAFFQTALPEDARKGRSAFTEFEEELARAAGL